jgi:hypothetical protein
MVLIDFHPMCPIGLGILLVNSDNFKSIAASVQQMAKISATLAQTKDTPIECERANTTNNTHKV